MPYEYYGYDAYGQPAPNSYEQPEQQQQQQPMGGMGQMMKMFGGGETGAAGGDLMGGGFGGGLGGGQASGIGGLQGGGAMGSQGGGAMVGNAGGGAAAGGGQGMGGAMAAAGPWAALAAAVIGNEISAKDEGRRGDDTNDWIRHAFGKGLSRDTEYMNEKMWGEDMRNDYLGIGGHQNMATNLMSGDFTNAWEDYKGTPGYKPIEWISDLF